MFNDRIGTKRSLNHTKKLQHDRPITHQKGDRSISPKKRDRPTNHKTRSPNH